MLHDILLWITDIIMFIYVVAFVFGEAIKLIFKRIAGIQS